MSEMLSSINFLFLFSLAVTSWVILCYLKQIEEQRMEVINDGYKMESTLGEALNPCHTTYDIYLNFFCVFACIYALVKVTCLTENYITRKLMERFGNRDDPSTLEDYRALQENLLLKIQQLQRLKIDLEQHLLTQPPEQLEPEPLLELDLEDIDMEMEEPLEEDDDEVVPNDREILQTEGGAPTIGQPKIVANSPNHTRKNKVVNTNKIIISNRHIHLNQPIYLNEGNIKLDLSNLGPKEAGDFSHTFWSKYLEKQRFINITGIYEPESKDGKEITTAAAVEELNPMPMVVSTEQLKSIKGIF